MAGQFESVPQYIRDNLNVSSPELNWQTVLSVGDLLDFASGANTADVVMQKTQKVEDFVDRWVSDVPPPPADVPEYHLLLASLDEHRRMYASVPDSGYDPAKYIEAGLAHLDEALQHTDAAPYLRPEILARQAQMNLSGGRVKVADGIVRELLSDYPQHPLLAGLCERMGIVCANGGDLEHAAMWLLLLKERFPDSPEAAAEAPALEKILGQMATRVAERSVSRQPSGGSVAQTQPARGLAAAASKPANTDGLDPANKPAQAKAGAARGAGADRERARPSQAGCGAGRLAEQLGGRDPGRAGLPHVRGISPHTKASTRNCLTERAETF